MRSKFLLFTGIILLSIGVLLRTITQLDNFGLFLIITGVICKLFYIITKIKNGEYKPGKELLVLALGLLLFFTGLYFVDTEQYFIKPVYLIVFGITLKTVFVLRFIQIIRSGKKSKKFN